jgi:hypothetical protein
MVRKWSTVPISLSYTTPISPLLSQLEDWLAGINAARSTLEEYVTDVYKAWAAIAVCGFLGGMVLSLAYMVRFRIWFRCLFATTAGASADDAAHTEAPKLRVTRFTPRYTRTAVRL